MRQLSIQLLTLIDQRIKRFTGGNFRKLVHNPNSKVVSSSFSFAGNNSSQANQAVNTDSSLRGLYNRPAKGHTGHNTGHNTATNKQNKINPLLEYPHSYQKIQLKQMQYIAHLHENNHEFLYNFLQQSFKIYDLNHNENILIYIKPILSQIKFQKTDVQFIELFKKLMSITKQSMNVTSLKQPLIEALWRKIVKHTENIQIISYLLIRRLQLISSYNPTAHIDDELAAIRTVCLYLAQIWPDQFISVLIEAILNNNPYYQFIDHVHSNVLLSQDSWYQATGLSGSSSSSGLSGLSSGSSQQQQQEQQQQKESESESESEPCYSKYALILLAIVAHMLDWRYVFHKDHTSSELELSTDISKDKLTISTLSRLIHVAMTGIHHSLYEISNYCKGILINTIHAMMNTVYDNPLADLNIAHLNHSSKMNSISSRDISIRASF